MAKEHNFQVGQRVSIIKAIGSIESDGSNRYYIGGNTNEMPIGSQGIIHEEGEILLKLKFDPSINGNDIWNVHHTEIQLAGDITAKSIFLDSLKLQKENEKREKREKKEREEKEAREKKLKEEIKKFKIGQLVMFKINKDTFVIGDKGIIYQKGLYCINVRGVERHTGYTTDIKPDEIELINLNGLMPISKRGKMFMPMKQLKFKVYPIEKQIEMIKKLKEVESVLLDKDNNICVTTKNIIVDYSGSPIDTGKYHFYVRIDDGYPTISGRHYKGGYLRQLNDSRRYSNHMYFSPTDIEHCNRGIFSHNICYGVQQNFAEQFKDEKNIYKLIMLSIDLLKSKSNDGYFSVERWKDFIKHKTAFDKEIPWRNI